MASRPKRRVLSQAPLRKSSSQPLSKTPLKKSAMKKSPPSLSTQAARKKAAETTTSSSAFPASKQDKRRIKHSALLSKITKSSSSSSSAISKNARRKRRPNKKLVTALDSLMDALPDGDSGAEEEEEEDNDQTPGVVGPAAAAGRDRPRDQVNLIRRKSIKSRPGAMKRKEKLERGERERFAKNMAQMAGPGSAKSGQRGEIVAGAIHHSQETSMPTAAAAAAAAATSTSEKWAALRGFISQTLEQNPEMKRIKT